MATTIKTLEKLLSDHLGQNVLKADLPGHGGVLVLADRGHDVSERFVSGWVTGTEISCCYYHSDIATAVASYAERLADNGGAAC